MQRAHIRLDRGPASGGPQQLISETGNVEVFQRARVRGERRDQLTVDSVGRSSARWRAVVAPDVGCCARTRPLPRGGSHYIRR
jgi:hypothetical protein